MHIKRLIRSVAVSAAVSVVVPAAILSVVGCDDSAPSAPDAGLDPAAPYADTIAALSAHIDQAMEAHSITGLSIALVDGDTTVWARGFGHADIASDVAATDETPYRIASVTKLFTAISIMQLVEQGAIDLDGPIDDYIPELALRSRFSDSDPITVRSMLTHHSGMPSQHFRGESRGPLAVADYEAALDALPAEMAGQYVAAPPNHVFSYSNLAFDLLGVTVARVSGQSYTEYVRQNIIEPLGLQTTFFDPKGDAVAKGYAAGEATAPVDVDRALPAGGLFSSAADLAEFAKMILADGTLSGAEILRASTLSDMLGPQTDGVSLDFGFQYGLGVAIEPPLALGDMPVAGHGGDWSPYHSWLQVLPESGLGVIVLTNDDAGAFVIEEIAVEALVRAYEAKTGATPLAHQAAPADQEPADAVDFAGTYATSIGMAEVVADEGLKLRLMDGLEFALVYYDDGTWRLDTAISPFDRMRMRLARVDGERYAGLFLDSYLFSTARVVEVKAVPEAWRARVGAYRVANPMPDEITAVDALAIDYDADTGLLTVSVVVYGGLAAYTMPLDTLSDSDAVISGIGRNLGETVRAIESDGEERLVYSGYEFVPVAAQAGTRPRASMSHQSIPSILKLR